MISRRPTIDDVARLAGVSIKTVSRVFNQEPNVRQATRDRVVTAAESLDYEPNLSARRLASKRTFLVGMLYDRPNPENENDYVTTVQSGSLDVCREVGAGLLLDAAQSCAVLPELGLDADIVAFAGHKGPQGPQGIGGLWVAPGIGFEPPDYCDVGGVNLAGACGVAAGLEWLAERGADPFAVARAARAALRDALVRHPGCRVLGGGGEHTAALSFRLDTLPLAEAASHFQRHGIWIRAGRHCAGRALAALGSPEGSIRISFGPEASAADADAVMAAVEAAPRPD